jgi:hypothetical protein
VDYAMRKMSADDDVMLLLIKKLQYLSTGNSYRSNCTQHSRHLDRFTYMLTVLLLLTTTATYLLLRPGKPCQTTLAHRYRWSNFDITDDSDSLWMISALVCAWKSECALR